ncbi:MAG: alpha/beta hydrolase [Rhodanobacter sp.]
MGRNHRPTCCLVVLSALALLPLVVQAQRATLRERLLQRHADAMMAGTRGPVTLPPDTRVVRDVAYGSDPRQRFDVYVPDHAQQAPVIFMVHGGGWRRGDKGAHGVVQNKIDRWLPRGFVAISVNYRMRPDTAPLDQARDVARALARAQQQAGQWGVDANAFILMGHSAGAHLVALLAADPALAREQGARPWLGTIALDSAALDVVQIMQGRHPRLYDEAFGAQPSDWLEASPLQQMSGRMVPFLAVCSSQRRQSCARAHAFVRKAKSFGGEALVLEEDLAHGQINAELGQAPDYTDAVERFMGSLAPAVARRLGPAQERTVLLSSPGR